MIMGDQSKVILEAQQHPRSRRRRGRVNVKKLIDQIQRRVEENAGEFRTVEYVEFVLTEFLKDEPEQVYTLEEEEEIKKRLRAPGYIE